MQERRQAKKSIRQQVAACTRVCVSVCCLVIGEGGAVLKTEAALPVYTGVLLFQVYFVMRMSRKTVLRAEEADSLTCEDTTSMIRT